MSSTPTVEVPSRISSGYNGGAMVVESHHTSRTPVGVEPPSFWLSDARTVQLREWGTNNVYPLLVEGREEILIGSAPEADVRFSQERQVSRRHALLKREGTQWLLKDLQSTNHVYVDGHRRRSCRLSPGMEIGIGSLVRLIPESEQSIALRHYLARVFSWDVSQFPAIDEAARAIRMALSQRGTITLVGTDDLVSFARQIHRRTLGPGAPFVVCAPKPNREDLALQIPSCEDYRQALELAQGGTLCVRAERLPRSFDKLVTAFSDRSSHAQLAICSQPRKHKTTGVELTVDVPPLSKRSPDEFARIVFEYGIDAIREFRAPEDSFTRDDQDQIVRRAERSWESVETFPRRLVALRAAGNVHSAAHDYLQMSHTGLSKWLRAQKLG